MANRFIAQYATEMLAVLTQANGWIRHDEATLRFKNRMFPRSVRTAGVVRLAEEALEFLVKSGKVVRQQGERVRTYRVK